ncbi:GNAT family N-acetyltransferase [Modicisalibacter xianhensis]|uniref:Acetyltransferase (GNAT) family protein n=1 Tax=Modicisalibacter xianhensis TaxID=442341 RepID=A0A1I2Y2S1_9GAMM|nr:GNAT family N-acetyltransferase [Halomonas xianhensis]SFH19246.1 Acetyltransferase (GNAT) family protein [Halomonas xianhensis]
MERLALQKMDDVRFAERLILGNMQADYMRHDMKWDSNQFAKSWLETTNYALKNGKQTIGLVRVKIQAELFYLIDLQVMESWRGQGVGSKVLDEVRYKAREANCVALRLKVFADSEAVQLYLRKGFQTVKQEGALLFMEARL